MQHEIHEEERYEIPLDKGFAEKVDNDDECEICTEIEGGFVDNEGQWHHDIHCPHHPINKINEGC